MVTAHDVHTVTFEKSMRGYSVEQVDEFLDKIAAQLEQDEAAIAELNKSRAADQAKFAEQSKKLETYISYEDALKAALLNAQRMGENVIREAKQKADALVREASIRADDITRAAESKTEEQKIELERVRGEVAQFKTSVLSLYKAHIESLSTLPDNEPAPAEEETIVPVEAEMPAPVQKQPEPEKPEPAAPAAPEQAAPAVPEKAQSSFWDQDETELTPEAAPEEASAPVHHNFFGQAAAAPEAAEEKTDSFRGISFSD